MSKKTDPKGRGPTASVFSALEEVWAELDKFKKRIQKLEKRATKITKNGGN